VKEVVLAVNYQPEVMLRAMQEVEAKFGIKVSFSIEEEPLGTGSARLDPCNKSYLFYSWTFGPR
jgi:hypothetical protein